MFDIDKFNGLTVILVNLHLKSIEGLNIQEYCSTEDLYACLNLIKGKIDTLLVDTQSQEMKDCLDSFSLILNIMGTMGTDGLRKDTIQEIEQSFEVFHKVC